MIKKYNQEQNEQYTKEFFNPVQGRKSAQSRHFFSEQKQLTKQYQKQIQNENAMEDIEDFGGYSQNQQQQQLIEKNIRIPYPPLPKNENPQQIRNVNQRKRNHNINQQGQEEFQKYEKQQNQKKNNQQVKQSKKVPKKQQGQVYQPVGNEPIVLMVAEKPSIAKSMAEALSGQWGGHKTRKGVSQFCRIHEYYGEIFGQMAFIKITSVTGHIYITDFSNEFQDWHKVDPLLLFDATTVKKEANPGNNLIKHLRQEAQDISYLILWLDNDKEGENICFEVVDNVKDFMRPEPFKQIYRARFSSITKQDILHTFNTLSEGPNKFEAIAVDARQIIDLKIGVAFSRFQTIYLKKKYESLTQRLITFGPCQTPTLGFCVERYQQIKNFQQQDFWRVVPQIVLLPDKKNQSLDWDKERTYDEAEAIKVKQELEQIKLFQVVDVTQKESTKGRPQALDTVHLLKAASSQLQLGPNQAMQVAEQLYLGGYTTYPRTESTSYPKNFDFGGVINSLVQIPQYSEYVKKLITEGLERPKIGKDAGDHPPITPTLKVPQSTELNEIEYKMYDYICRHFLGSVSSDAKLSKQIAKFCSGKHNFSVQGTTILNYGFTEIMPWIKLHDKIIPNFSKGQNFVPVKIDVVLGKTTPPDYLSESDLITLMEKNGIGTDASMASHINNICERNYVEVKGVHRKLLPTPLGISLVGAYNKIDNELVAPNLRQNIEQSVDLIAKGVAACKKVLEEVVAIFKEKFIYFRSNISLMDDFFKDQFATYYDAINSAQLLSECGRCGQLMKYLSNSNKLHCPQCRYTYSLPLGGELSLYDEQAICPLDSFQLVMFKPNSFDSQPLLLCPACYNKSPYPQINTHLKCMDCPVKDCRFRGFQFIQNDVKTKNQKQNRKNSQKAKVPNKVPQQKTKKQENIRNDFQKIPLPPSKNNNSQFIQKRQRSQTVKENMSKQQQQNMIKSEEGDNLGGVGRNSRKNFKKTDNLFK